MKTPDKTDKTATATNPTPAAATATPTPPPTPPPPVPTPSDPARGDARPTDVAPLPYERQHIIRMPRAIKLTDGTRLIVAAIAAYRPEGKNEIVFLNSRNGELGREKCRDSGEDGDQIDSLEQLDDLFGCVG